MPWGTPPFTPADALLVVLMAVATWTDARTRLIKNWLTLPTMVAGLALSAWHLPHWWSGAAGLLLAWALGEPLRLLGRVLSGGDVKMLMAAGSLMGPTASVRAVLFAVALILPVGVVVLALNRRLGNVPAVLQGKAPPTYMFHAAVVSAAILLARLQPWPVL